MNDKQQQPDKIFIMSGTITHDSWAIYLHLETQEAKSRLGLTTYRWDRVYIFIQAGNLLMQRKGEVVATLLMELDKTVSIQPVEVDDRR